MVRAAEVRPSGELHMQSGFPLVLAIIFLASQIVPWALTCVVARNPGMLVNSRDQEAYISLDFYEDYTVTTTIDVLNAMGVVVSLPILSALLARAAVVYSQKRKRRRQLTVRQLFALADRSWLDALSVLQRSRSSVFLNIGYAFLLVAFVLPIM